MPKEFTVTSDFSREIDPSWIRVRLPANIMPVYRWAEETAIGDYTLSVSFIFFENEQDMLFYKLKFGV